MKADLTLYDLSAVELELRGGDWWEATMGFVIMTAFLAGALAAPQYLAVSLGMGAAMLLRDALMTWY